MAKLDYIILPSIFAVRRVNFGEERIKSKISTRNNERIVSKVIMAERALSCLQTLSASIYEIALLTWTFIKSVYSTYRL